MHDESKNGNNLGQKLADTVVEEVGKKITDHVIKGVEYAATSAWEWVWGNKPDSMVFTDGGGI